MTRPMVRGGGGTLTDRGVPDRQPYRIPQEMQDAVEKWARKSGRHAEIVWCPPPLGCFSVEISLRPSDPRMKQWQEGELEEKPTESVRLHICKDGARKNPHTGQPMPGYVPIDLRELGTQGLLRHLRRGDTWSGRGEFDSIREAVQSSLDDWKKQKEKERQRAKDRAIQMGLSIRRQICDIPLKKVGIELDGFSPEQSESESVETD